MIKPTYEFLMTERMTISEALAKERALEYQKRDINITKILLNQIDAIDKEIRHFYPERIISL